MAGGGMRGRTRAMAELARRPRAGVATRAACGAADRNRTRNPRLRRPVLYPVELPPPRAQVYHQPLAGVEARATSLGYDVNRYKLLAFVLSAALTGLAGATMALVFVSAILSDVVWQMSGLVILMTLVGGMGTLTGPMPGHPSSWWWRTRSAKSAPRSPMPPG